MDPTCAKLKELYAKDFIDCIDIPEKGPNWKGLLMEGSRNRWLNNNKVSLSRIQFKPATYTDAGVSLHGVWIKKPSESIIRYYNYEILSLGFAAHKSSDHRLIFALD